MTNLIATIVIAVVTTTNDIPRWTPQVCRDGGAEWVMYIDEISEGMPVVDWQTGKTNSFVRFPVGSGLIDRGNERVRIVQTKRVAKTTFDLAGKKREIIDEEILDEKRTILVRHETWEEETE